MLEKQSQSSQLSVAENVAAMNGPKLWERMPRVASFLVNAGQLGLNDFEVRRERRPSLQPGEGSLLHYDDVWLCW